ncbi:TPA: carbohydrate ABC transporter substrate-binding protein, partial [Candidatus Avacholeplasma faecigallinarum]|nr:carbohydrate ABC transporter substrate-binding protein [Candidatus Avacholeplasma faecigallinarum]
MKKIISCLILIVMIISLASCHGRMGMPNFVCPYEFDDSQDYTITFWAKNDSNPTQRRIYEKAISDFEAIYPNIHVEISHYASYPEIYEAVIQNIGTNTTPNVAICYPDHVATYLEDKTRIVELDELINNPQYGLGGNKLLFESPSISEFVLEYLMEGYIKMDGIEKLYSLPFMRSTECLYVNKTWLIDHGFEIPENNIFSWDYIWEICRKAYEIDKDMIPLIYKSSDNFFIELAYQNNYGYTDADGNILFSNDDNKKMVQNLNDLYKENLFVTWQNTGLYPGDKFNKGETIFGIDSSAGSTWIGPSSPLGAAGNKDFEVLVTTIPQVDVNNPLVISQGPSLCLFNKENPQEVLASWIFLQFLLTNDTQVNYAKTEGYSPVTTNAINSKEFQDFLNSDDTYSVQRDAILNVIEYKSKTFITPAFNGSTLV